MKSLKLDCRAAEEAFGEMAKDYAVIAPRTMAGRGRFSDTDLVTYESVDSLGEVEFFAQTFFSAKSVLFPIREALFDCDGEDVAEVRADLRPTVVFLRACDVAALSVLDTMFLEQGGREDCYYARRRKQLTCFLIDHPLEQLH